MKATWSCDHRGGGRSKFMSTKKRPADYKEMDTLLTYAVAKALRFKNNLYSLTLSPIKQDNNLQGKIDGNSFHS